MDKLLKNTTIELVGYGHPDRFADYIGELVLTENLKQDKNAKVALEVLATRNSISLGGEITSKSNIDYEALIFKAIDKIYGEKWWPNYKGIKIYNHIETQSPELFSYQSEGIVAGDQGVVYGLYDKPRFLLIEKLYELMNDIKKQFDIAPDWKLLFDQESKELSMSVCGKVDHLLIEKYVKSNFDLASRAIINPKGEWLIPGPLGDTGVIGRKLMIDTFGAGVPHGGGAFAGKDPSKIDKTGIIIASFMAKDAAKFKGVDRALVELNYKIGDSLPKAYVYYDNLDKSDITDTVNLTLDQYIKTYGLLEEDWSEYVLNGGVISYINKKTK